MALLYLDDKESPFNLLAFYPYNTLAKYIQDNYNYYYDVHSTYILNYINNQLLYSIIYIYYILINY